MELLLDDYKRKLVNITQMIDDLPSNCPDQEGYVRLKTKASCYQTFIAELEREIYKNNKN